MRGRGDKQLPASSPGQDLGSKPSQCTPGGLWGHQHPKESQSLPAHMHTPADPRAMLLPEPARGAGAELQPLWTGLLPLLSRSCFVCKPSARRPAEGAQMDGLFENSLK